jgi:glycosyltransferase involved in cell wall biosynthesis
MKYPISLYLIAGNEEAHIKRVIESFKPIAEEVIVCMARGSATPDKTEEIALSLGAKVIHYKNKKTDWPHIDDFASARNTALDACKNEWSIWVDADDVMAEDGEKVLQEGLEQAEKVGSEIVCFRYLVENAGLNPIREMALRKGCGRWKNRVHEALEPNDRNKLLAIDKVFRIHRPITSKADSADRNHRILADELTSTPFHLYYQHQEFFLRGQIDKAIEVGERALAFPDLDETLKYELLCNLGRCSPNEKRFRYLGEAVAVNPIRREAYFYLMAEYSARGDWPKAWHSGRACMAMPRPHLHYWNQVHAIYDWQALDGYRMASICYSQKEEVAKLMNMYPKPKISIVHATRGRPQIAFQRKMQWLALAKDPLAVEWLFMVDHDEKVDYTPHDAKRVNPGGIINAWNEGAKMAKSEVIVQMSDDWSPPRYWDALILSRIDNLEAERVLAVSDGLRTDKLLCMAILTQKRLRKQGGYMFHPSYQESDGIYSDNEFTERAYADDCVVEARDLVFRHENPMFGGGTPDEQLKNHNKPEFYEKGKAIYEKRKANNWA